MKLTFSTIKALYYILTGGMSGILKYVNNTINTQCLAKIKDKETAAKYLKDTQAITACISILAENHKKDLSEKKKQALSSITATLNELSKALEDFKLEESETKLIIQRVNEAIDVFKKS